ncbi:ORF102 protein [Operophtera brumata nucleopolyhedrovirus]|uniref:ORF102 protein n=1 Tax=Operophtera brumata nucleopolyhedrovirus TaxID=1046267 RepID=A0A2H4UZV9_9ABAC|nr:ORF102 protein [Operophtera brumata nucleopolyhedrovirus]AUA60333.1 ORF102 protein [Operophtera brumata nucleopolyhedrovirus]
MMRLRDNRKPKDFYWEEKCDVARGTALSKIKISKLYGIKDERFNVLRKRNFAKRQCCHDDLYKMKQRVNTIIDYGMRTNIGLLYSAMEGMTPVMNRRTCACCNFYSCALKCFGSPTGIYFYCINRVVQNIHMCRLKYVRLLNLFNVDRFKKFSLDEPQFVIENIKIVSKKMLDINDDEKIVITPSTAMYSLYLTRIFINILIWNYLDEAHMMQLSQFFIDTNCKYGMYVMSNFNENMQTYKRNDIYRRERSRFLCREKHVSQYQDVMYATVVKTYNALIITSKRHYAWNRSRIVKLRKNVYQTIDINN